MNYNRRLQRRIEQALADTPAVMLLGARQSGKTTLARLVGDARGYKYISFDDELQRAAADTDPVGFVADLPERSLLDEVQLVPSLFRTLKHAIDKDRQPGRFILTGSANLLIAPKLSDSLAGRLEILQLRPLAQSEIEDTNTQFIHKLFLGSFKKERGERLGGNLLERVVAGGYPAAVKRTTAHRRAAWYADYAKALVQQDIQALAHIRSLDSLPRLLQLAATQTSSLLNVSDLSAPLAISRGTVTEYLALLEHLFLLERLPPWHHNRLSRLIKTPKLHIADSGLAAALLGMSPEALTHDRSMLGRLVETFVFQELRRQAGWQDQELQFFHYRDKDGVEVDVVIEQGPRVAGVEVKAGSTVTSSDFRGLRALQEATKDRFAAGVVLYDGEAVVRFGEGLFAVPLSVLWR
jgi:uncharacterized protein